MAIRGFGRTNSIRAWSRVHLKEPVRFFNFFFKLFESLIKRMLTFFSQPKMSFTAERCSIWYTSVKRRQFSRFTIRCATSYWLRRGQNSHCIMGKCPQTHATKYKITLEHVSNDLKMWIKRFQTEIHNKITIYINNRSIYFKIIICIILG